jgi:mono/diheme cytochrome c family protein
LGTTVGAVSAISDESALVQGIAAMVISCARRPPEGSNRLSSWRRAFVLVIALCATAPAARGQESARDEDVRKGRQLAIVVCANCHVSARDQPHKPILNPPAPSFESIAQRKGVDAAWVEAFLATTHKGLDRPRGMPNPELLEDQGRQVAAYLLSLRKRR